MNRIFAAPPVFVSAWPILATFGRLCDHNDSTDLLFCMFLSLAFTEAFVDTEDYWKLVLAMASGFFMSFNSRIIIDFGVLSYNLR